MSLIEMKFGELNLPTCLHRMQFNSNQVPGVNAVSFGVSRLMKLELSA